MIGLTCHGLLSPYWQGLAACASPNQACILRRTMWKWRCLHPLFCPILVKIARILAPVPALQLLLSSSTWAHVPLCTWILPGSDAWWHGQNHRGTAKGREAQDQLPVPQQGGASGSGHGWQLGAQRRHCHADHPSARPLRVQPWFVRALFFEVCLPAHLAGAPASWHQGRFVAAALIVPGGVPQCMRLISQHARSVP